MCKCRDRHRKHILMLAPNAQEQGPQGINATPIFQMLVPDKIFYYQKAQGHLAEMAA